eukprot:scaffold1034_cov127-Cylindrotheca_fusiformis.AAC.8
MKPTEGQPLKAIEHNGKIFEGPTVAGQHLDHLYALSMFGFKRLVGMISTFNRCCLTSSTNCTEEEDRYLDVKTVRDQLKKLERGGEEEETSPPNRQFKEAFQKGTAISDGERVLYCSDVVPHLEPDLPKDAADDVAMAAHFVVSAVKSLLDVYRPNFSSGTVAIQKTCVAREILIDGEDETADVGTECVFTGFSAEMVNVRKHISDGTKTVWIIAPLALPGYTALAASRNGDGCCLVKYFTESQQRYKELPPVSLTREEQQNWKSAHQPGLPGCKTAKVPDGLWLILPYLIPIPQSQRSQLLEDGSMKEALSRFATDTKHIRLHVEWKHFGYFFSTSSEAVGKKDTAVDVERECEGGKLYLGNLQRIKRYKTDAEREQWVIESLESLKELLAPGWFPTVIVPSSAAIESSAEGDGSKFAPTTSISRLKQSNPLKMQKAR